MDNIYQLVLEHMNDIAVPPELGKLKTNFNYPWLWAYLDLKGKEKQGVKFRLLTDETEIILKIMIWWLRDQELAVQYKIDLQAGLMVSGPVGCGKTSLVKLCSLLPNSREKPLFKPCREISFEVETDGPASILHYTRHSFDYANEKPRIYIFDDLGVETVVNYFGNLLSPMCEIIAGRYDYYMSHGMQTIITTNLSATQIEQRYGARVRSRLREMMNLVAFPAAAADKR